MNTPYESPLDLNLFYQGDKDEAYLRRMSVYATVRSGEEKEIQRTDQLRSLENVLSVWSVPGQEYDDGKCEPDNPNTADICDAPQQELIVKGFEIDNRVVPGFKYTVRYADKDEYLFDGTARRLESIGRGYGRRITFQGDTLNKNDCYFWSDSSLEGFIFNISAVSDADVFSIIDSDSQVIGELVVHKVDFPQIEKDMYVDNNDIVKKVGVKFGCSVNYFLRSGILIDIFNMQSMEVVDGDAELVKKRGTKSAFVRSITNVHLSKLGKCSLVPDS